MKSLYFITILFGLILLVYIFSAPQNVPQQVSEETIFYDKDSPNPNIVISDELRTPTTLEEVAVNEMVFTKQDENQPLNSPRFHPIMPNAAGAAALD